MDSRTVLNQPPLRRSPLGAIDEAVLTRLFDAALDAVVGMEADGTVSAWNRQAEAMFGWSREEAVGKVLGDLIIPERFRAAHAAGLQRYLATGEGPVLNQRIEVEGLRRSGEDFPIELTILPLETGDRRHFFAFLRDITQRREAEQRIRRQTLEAEVLWDAARLAATGGSLTDLLRGCLERICQVTGWQVGHVYLPDDTLRPQYLVSGEVWTVASEDFLPITQSTLGTALRLGEGLPGRIWQAGSAQWFPDLSVEDFPRRDLFLRHGLHAAFGFPVHAQGRLQAVLEFFSTAKRAPDQHLLHVVQGLGEQLGRVLERRLANEQRDVLMGELSHRIGNTLAVIQSVFLRSAAHARTVEELSSAFQARLISLASAHRHLASGHWRSAELTDLIRSTLEPYCSAEGENCRTAGEPLLLPATTVMPLSMALHELATNAAKHGALATPEGVLEVSWSAVEAGDGSRQLAIRWEERGAAGNPAAGAAGYGTNLIDMTVERGLGGTVTRAYRPGGILVEIAVPLQPAQ